MKFVAHSKFQKNLHTYMKKINKESCEIAVTGENIEDTIVVMSKRDYDAMQETLSVLSNKYVIDKINRGDNQFNSYKGGFGNENDY